MENIEIEVETKKIVKLVKAASVNGIIETPVIGFEETGVKIWTKDPADIVGAFLSFDRNYFIEYKVREECKVCFDTSKLLKMLGYITDENIILRIGAEKARVKSAGQEITVPLLELGREMKLMSLLKEENNKVVIGEQYPVSISIENISKNAMRLGEDVTSLINKENRLFMEQCSDDGYVFSESVASLMAVDDFSISLSTMYMEGILSALITDEIEISLNPKTVMPVIIENEGDNYRLLFLLAPRIPDENYQ